MGEDYQVTAAPRIAQHAPTPGPVPVGRAVLPPLRIGPIVVDTPVVLAPMAGVTNRAFRRLCREHGAGLYVAEMVTSRALVERTPESLRIIAHDDDDRLTYLEAGRAAEDAGVAAVALHARTAADYYSGTADWDAIARLKEAVTSIPVLGNGDIWSAEDALAMVAQTGCDGVVVGRGCQGRPWLFADLAAAFHGSDVRVRPGLGEVAAVIRRHAELMVDEYDDERRPMREMRKHMAWYLKGYVVGGALRAQLGLVETLAHLDELLGRLDLDQPYPGEAAEGQRGRAGSPKRPTVPAGWLDSHELDDSFRAALHEAELSVSGG